MQDYSKLVANKCPGKRNSAGHDSAGINTINNWTSYLQ